jgi:hypothetical protein
VPKTTHNLKEITIHVLEKKQTLENQTDRTNSVGANTAKVYTVLFFSFIFIRW